jgi:hypothetical protein
MPLPDLSQPLIEKALNWGILSFGVRYLSSISKNLEKLNVKMAQLFERTQHHERTLERHDERISDIERAVPRRK